MTARENSRVNVDVKTKIILAAEQLFAQHGYDNTSVNAIILNAGVSKGGFYHHFKTKEDIILAILEFEANQKEYFPTLAELPQDPKKRFITLVDLWFNGIKEKKSLLSWMLPLIFQPKMKSIMQHIYESENNHVNHFLIEIFTALKMEKPEMEAQMFKYFFSGIKMELAINKELDLDSLKKHILHKYLKNL